MNKLLEFINLFGIQVDEFSIKEIYDNFKEYLSTLENEELLALFHLFLNGLILSSITSIGISLFASYLLDKFQLEIRYPKIAKIIKLRKTLKDYYIKINIFYILFSFILIFYLDLSILFKFI